MVQESNVSNRSVAAFIFRRLLLVLSSSIRFSDYCQSLGVSCTKIRKNIEDIMDYEHKLRKRVLFSFDMASLHIDFILQIRN